MKKYIKILVCFLILIMIIPINIYAGIEDKFFSDEELSSMSIEELINESRKCISGTYEKIAQNAGVPVDQTKCDKYYRKVLEATVNKLEKADLEKLNDTELSEDVEFLEELISDVNAQIGSVLVPKLKEKFENEILKRYGSKQIDNYIINGGPDKVEENLSKLSNEVLVEWSNNIGEEASKKYIDKELKKRGLEEYINYPVADFDYDYWKPTTGDNATLTAMTGKILGVIQVFGAVISVGVLIVLGIKYMLGSVEEKAKYKETMIPYIVGCIMLFATTNIASIIYKFAKGI